MDHYWQIQLLGELTASRDGGKVCRFQSRKTGNLLAYLAYHVGQFMGRDDLSEMFWPETDLEHSRHSLNQSLHSLRNQFEPPGVSRKHVFESTRSHVRLSPHTVTTDVQAFRAAVSEAGSARSAVQRIELLGNAVDIYRGHLLTGWDDEWTLPERDRLAIVFVQTLRRLLKELEQRGDRDRAIECGLRAVSAIPDCEEASQDLIKLYLFNGQTDEAVRRFKRLQIAMGRTGECPSKLTRNLVERYLPLGFDDMRLFQVKRAQRSKFTERRERLQQQHQVESEAESDTKPLERRTPRLPAQHTRFFGREEEISQLMEMLSPASETDSTDRTAVQRLVTLLGPGGSGKTRLATQVAGKLVDAFDGAVYFVSLADVVEEHGIAEATLSALGIQAQPSRKPIAQIAGQLADGPALLVLDNMEQLPGWGAQFVSELLAKVPEVVCLATSRKVIGLDGEREFQVRPLPVPTMPGTPDRLIEFASVQMFVDRAQNVHPDFQVTDRNAEALAAVCEKLEGIPLAIELAAARVKALTPAQILTQLEDRFGFLVSRNSNRDTRHQTLRAAFDWSFDLLSEELRRFLAVLSVFRGGWSLEAARAITADPDALTVLEQLIERSLVIPREFGDEMRYQMLESLREYASEKLSEKARSMALLRHAQFFGRVAEEAEPKLRWSEADEWIERLDADRLNLMSALAFTKGEEDGLRLAGALWRFWYLRGYHHEGLEQLETALAASPAGTPEARAKANLGLGVLAQHLGDPGHADALLQSSLELAQETGDAFLTGEALHNLALLASQRGDRGQARDLSEQALAQRYAIDDQWGAAATLCTLGSIEQGLGNGPEAEKYYRESRRIYDEIGDDRQSALVLNNLGTLSLENGDLAEARLSHELSLSLFRQQKNRWAVAAALNNLGDVALGQGDTERAVDLFRQSLRQLYDLGDKAAAVNPLAGLGIVARKGGDPIRAARLLGASHALRMAQDAALSQAGQAQFDVEVAEVRDDLSPADFKAAWDYGSSLSWKKIVAYALEQEFRETDAAPLQILTIMR